MLVQKEYVGPLETRRRASLTPALEANLGISVEPLISLISEELRGVSSEPPKLGAFCSSHPGGPEHPHLPAPKPGGGRDSLGMILPHYYPLYHSHLKALRFLHPAAVKDAAAALPDAPQLYQWSYDVTRCAPGAPVLATVGYRVFQDFGVAKILRIPAAEAPELLYNWLTLIETVYHQNNPYHNNVHAADVLQAVAYFLLDAVLRSQLSDLDVAALLLGAAMHDADHPGVSSQYLINRKHDLAVLYNDISVLENHHLALSFHLTTKIRPDCNIFKYLTAEEFKLFRARTVSNILATDMERHVKIMAEYRSAMSSSPPLELTGVQPAVAEASGSDSDPPAPPAVGNGTGAPPKPTASSPSPTGRASCSQHAALVAQLVIKCADISNPARPWAACTEWADRVFREFHGQWRREKDACLPETMAFFSAAEKLPQCQIGFIDLFARDVFTELSRICPRVNEPGGPIEQMEANYLLWTEKKNNSLNPAA